MAANAWWMSAFTFEDFVAFDLAYQQELDSGGGAVLDQSACLRLWVAAWLNHGNGIRKWASLARRAQRFCSLAAPVECEGVGRRSRGSRARRASGRRTCSRRAADARLSGIPPPLFHGLDHHRRLEAKAGRSRRCWCCRSSSTPDLEVGAGCGVFGRPVGANDGARVPRHCSGLGQAALPIPPEFLQCAAPAKAGRRHHYIRECVARTFCYSISKRLSA